MSDAVCPAGYHGFEPFDMNNPFPSYEELRKEQPVMFDDRVGYYVVTRYDDVKSVFENWQTFSSENAQAPVRPISAAAKKVMDDGGFTAYSGLSARIPPEHTRIRAVASKAFTPRRYKVLEPFIRDNTNIMIGEMLAKGDAGGDILADIAYELPAITILTLLGVPVEKIPEVKAWATSRAVITWGELTDEEQIPHAHNLVKYWSFCQELVANAHANPGDNLVSDMVALQQAGDEISDHEIASVLYSMLFAGHETTTTLISNAVRVLLQHRVAYEALVADPEKIPGAIDEVLRYSPSIVAWRRKAVQDGEIGGVKIPKGSEILLVMGSANRDENVFDQPDAFNIDRENSRNHLAFGYGIHYCLGNMLAKLQAKVALEEITKNVPSLRLKPETEIKFGENLSFRVPTAVPVEWN
ncbi:cytochrome P450 [Rhodoluna sp.]|uniref:cytochrome P450 n=1 Tax=Rhodoluna sp. TaxID=1969481 RepID=UPI0025EAC0BB|nr:cytochrome P450 [Rhodoluna sp.]